MAPSISPARYTGTWLHAMPPLMARPIVTAGLRCAPDFAAMYAPVRTAKPHPKVMATHPALCALERLKVTAAQTPPPSRSSTAVPMVSLRKMSELDTGDSFVLRPGEGEPRVPPVVRALREGGGRP